MSCDFHQSAVCAVLIVLASICSMYAASIVVPPYVLLTVIDLQYVRSIAYLNIQKICLKYRHRSAVRVQHRSLFYSATGMCSATIVITSICSMYQQNLEACLRRVVSTSSGAGRPELERTLSDLSLGVRETGGLT